MVVLAIVMGMTTQSIGCENDTVTIRLVDERNQGINSFMDSWLNGAPEEELVEKLATIMSDELFLSSFCRKDIDYLKNHIVLLSEDSEPSIDKVPGILLEHLIGEPVLQVDENFLSRKN